MDRRRLLLAVAAVVAALGVALVFVYVRGAEARAAEKYDATEVLVATQKINPGESIESALENGKAALEPVSRNLLLEGATGSTKALQGKVALTTIYPNEQLIPARFGGADEVEAASILPIPEGKLAISVAISDDGRLGTFLRPGAEIAVFVTLKGSGREPQVSRLLLQRVTVLGAGSATAMTQAEEGASDSSGDLQQLITLAVTQQEAQKVRFAEGAGELSAALLNGTSKVTPDAGVNSRNLFD